MKSFTNSVVIRKTLEEVYDFFTDPNKLSKVVNNSISIEQLTEGPFDTGTKLKNTFVENGEEKSSILEVVEYIPEHIFTIKNVRDHVEATYRYFFVTDKDGTYVEYVAEIHIVDMDEAAEQELYEAIKNHDLDHLQEIKGLLEPSGCGGCGGCCGKKHK